MMNHDLYDFFKKANREIMHEYDRIARRVNEDPGTAGDQGEENWKELLKEWIPGYFNIVTKGRIIGYTGKTSPQIDILILSPDYPNALLSCKEYLSDCVVAAFECKTTLRKEHIEEFMLHSKEMDDIIRHETGTPHKDLSRRIYYGLLCHSHEWKKERSKPKENIKRALIECDERIITHPKQMPNSICVADLTTWNVRKMVTPTEDDVYKKLSVMTTYVEAFAEEEVFTPIGSMMFDLLNYLAWDYLSIRRLVDYMRQLNLSGAGKGHSRKWKSEVLSEQTLKCIGNLKNGGFWNEWGMVI